MVKAWPATRLRTGPSAGMFPAKHQVLVLADAAEQYFGRAKLGAAAHP